MMQSHDAILTVPEVALDLRCSDAHAYKLVRGEVRGVAPLPALFMGRRRMVRRSALEAWKAANERVVGDGILRPSLEVDAADASRKKTCDPLAHQRPGQDGNGNARRQRQTRSGSPITLFLCSGTAQ